MYSKCNSLMALSVLNWLLNGDDLRAVIELAHKVDGSNREVIIRYFGDGDKASWEVVLRRNGNGRWNGEFRCYCKDREYTHKLPEKVVESLLELIGNVRK